MNQPEHGMLLWYMLSRRQAQARLWGKIHQAMHMGRHASVQTGFHAYGSGGRASAETARLAGDSSHLPGVSALVHALLHWAFDVGLLAGDRTEVGDACTRAARDVAQAAVDQD